MARAHLGYRAHLGTWGTSGTWATFATWPGCGTTSTLPTIDVNAIDVPTIGIDPMREV